MWRGRIVACQMLQQRMRQWLGCTWRPVACYEASEWFTVLVLVLYHDLFSCRLSGQGESTSLPTTSWPRVFSSADHHWYIPMQRMCMQDMSVLLGDIHNANTGECARDVCVSNSN